MPDLDQVQNIQGDRFSDLDNVSSMDIPWSLSATLNYSENRRIPSNITKTFWMNTNVDFNLTKNWKITYRSRWDLEKKEAVSQDFVILRDLHCWEARFAITPAGPYKRFYFKINVKSSMLDELKFEKGRSSGVGLY